MVHDSPGCRDGNALGNAGSAHGSRRGVDAVRADSDIDANGNGHTTANIDANRHYDFAAAHGDEYTPPTANDHDYARADWQQCPFADCEGAMTIDQLTADQLAIAALIRTAMQQQRTDVALWLCWQWRRVDKRNVLVSSPVAAAVLAVRSHHANVAPPQHAGYRLDHRSHPNSGQGGNKERNL